MKEMNRREFLTLSGAAVVALSLAGCEDEGFGGSGAPGTPDSGSSLPPLPTTPFTVGRSPPLARRFRRLPIRPLFR